jgi:hypothetical protein
VYAAAFWISSPENQRQQSPDPAILHSPIRWLPLHLGFVTQIVLPSVVCARSPLAFLLIVDRPRSINSLQCRSALHPPTKPCSSSTTNSVIFRSRVPCSICHAPFGRDSPAEAGHSRGARHVAERPCRRTRRMMRRPLCFLDLTSL